MTGKLNIVIAGVGRVGHTTAQQLAGQGHDITAIERDESRCAELGEEYIATVIQGDASDPAILEQANLADKDVIGALTGETGTNLAVCLEAKEMNPNIRTVVRVDRPPSEHHSRFADAVVYPEHAGGRIAASAMSDEKIDVLMESPGELELMYIHVAEGAPAAGKQLQELQFPEGALVVSTAAGERIATAETILQPGKSYLVAVEPDVADGVVNLLRA